MENKVSDRTHEEREKNPEKFEYCVSGSFITLRDGLVGNFLANANSDMHFYFTDIHFLFAALTRSLTHFMSAFIYPFSNM